MNLEFIKISKYSNGFTLAEVLITLVIIGIIAAMTIPSLINNTRKQEWVAGLQKAYSTLQQAMITIAKNNDAAVGDFSFLNDINFMDEFAKVSNGIKKCEDLVSCVGTDYSPKYLNNSPAGLGGTTQKGVITSDGVIYACSYVTGFGTTHGLSAEDAEYSLGYILVDLNGQKKPNTFGRDLWLFELTTNKGIVPAGAHTTASCSTAASGVGCTSKVLREHAMNY